MRMVTTCKPTSELTIFSVIHTMDNPNTCSKGCSLPASV